VISLCINWYASLSVGSTDCFTFYLVTTVKSGRMMISHGCVTIYVRNSRMFVVEFSRILDH